MGRLALTNSWGALSSAFSDYASEALTENEECVLNLFARGSSRSEISSDLRLSESTVGHLLTSAKEKLHAKTLPHAVMLHVTRNLKRTEDA
jgi:DNA-binding CsgD family transcriptional regulator